jgi:sugar porter (SP) family MFS transporter
MFLYDYSSSGTSISSLHTSVLLFLDLSESFNKRNHIQSSLKMEPTINSTEEQPISGPVLRALIMDQNVLATSFGESGPMAFFKSPVVVLCAWAAAMCSFLYGYDQGLINVTLIIPEFLEYFPSIDETVTPHETFYKGLVTAIFELGAILGALQSAFFCDKYSRRYTIIVAVGWYLLGSIIQAASQNYVILVMGRLIGGIGVGGASMVAPLYTSEIAPLHLRGALLALQQWMLILGIVAAFYTTYGARHIGGNWSWRMAFVVQILPGLILLAIVYVLPISPRWLAIQGRDEKCLETIAMIRRLPIHDPRVQAEWINIRGEALLQARLSGVNHKEHGKTFQQHVKEEARKWARCFNPRYIKRVHVGIVINAFQQWIGVNGFTYYSNTLFQQLGYESEMRLTLSGLLCVVQLVGSTVPIFILDKVGRRPLLLIGSFMLMSCILSTPSLLASAPKIGLFTNRALSPALYSCSLRFSGDPLHGAFLARSCLLPSALKVPHSVLLPTGLTISLLD